MNTILFPFSFFSRQFENEFNRTLKNPAQVRYIIGFPMVCGEFLNATSPFCPEEVCLRVYMCILHGITMLKVWFLPLLTLCQIQKRLLHMLF